MEWERGGRRMGAGRLQNKGGTGAGECKDDVAKVAHGKSRTGAERHSRAVGTARRESREAAGREQQGRCTERSWSRA